MIPPPTPAVRRTVAGLSLSAAALVGILLHEGYTDRAVIPVNGDVPTIGFGATTEVEIAYYRPGVRGRTIWGDLVPWDKVWRLGANAA